MKPPACLKLLGHCLLSLSVLSGIVSRSPAQLPPSHAEQERTQQRRLEVRALLGKWAKNRMMVDTEFEELKAHLGSQALPLLAECLPDPELSNFAEWAMQRLDPVGATPYLLKNLPHKDASSQSTLFRAANRSLQEYAWFQRQSEAEKQQTLQPARYAWNTKPYPYTKELYGAARAVVQAQAQTNSEAEALLTLGLTGSKRDLPLLRRYLAHDPASQHCLSALARLGDKATLDRLAQELAKPAKTHPAEAYTTETRQKVEPKPGAMVTDTADGQRLRVAMDCAAFSLNRRFVALLIAHLDDPPGQFHGDYSDPSPSRAAEVALVLPKFFVPEVKQPFASVRVVGLAARTLQD